MQQRRYSAKKRGDQYSKATSIRRSPGQGENIIKVEKTQRVRGKSLQPRKKRDYKYRLENRSGERRRFTLCLLRIPKRNARAKFREEEKYHRCLSRRTGDDGMSKGGLSSEGATEVANRKGSVHRSRHYGGNPLPRINQKRCEGTSRERYQKPLLFHFR